MDGRMDLVFIWLKMKDVWCYIRLLFFCLKYNPVSGPSIQQEKFILKVKMLCIHIVSSYNNDLTLEQKYRWNLCTFDFFFSMYMSSSTEDWQTFPFISYRIDMDKCRMTITGTLMINFPFTLADVWKRSRGFLLRFTIVNSFNKAIKIMQRTFQFIWKNYDLERKLEQVSN